MGIARHELQHTNDEMVALEVDEWNESIRSFVNRYGKESGSTLLRNIFENVLPEIFAANLNTDYVNTISVENQPPYPGDLLLERTLTNIIRWNAAMMVLRANQKLPGIGGHLSTYASSADLFEVGFHHFFDAPSEDASGDFVYFQGHSSPGVYSRAFLEGRLSEHQLNCFRQEVRDKNGLSSYPHPWLMPTFWQFPTVSMGLSPIMGIYQARFLKYVQNRGLNKTSDRSRVWVFLGDGEMDEPESVGALSVASRENLDNLIFVVSCNLQRLDGPVRGNGNIIQELERLFKGAGWNVVKVVWGSEWDEILSERKHADPLIARLNALIDGESQKISVKGGAFFRKAIFNQPQLAKLAKRYSDDELKRFQYGGHDFSKIHAAYQNALESDRPTVVLARTVKGHLLGNAIAGRNVTHQQKKMDDDALRELRDRLEIPLGDQQVNELSFYKPDNDHELMKYLHQKRKLRGGYLPQRTENSKNLKVPTLKSFEGLLESSNDKEVSTTMAFGRILNSLLKDEEIGRYLVPIIPDEARTFGLEPLFGQFGIYSPVGQKYEPVDAGNLIEYRESQSGQILEEGITEAGAISSFVAAATAYSYLSQPYIPFFIFYSMFGFQRIGDLIWAAADSRSKGFLLGATAGRSSLSGEGLQHQDGHSHLIASVVPNLVSYDLAFGYELAIVIQNGLFRMYEKNEQIFYYITLYNDTYHMPAMESAEIDSENILRGIYRLQDGDDAHILASGPIVVEGLRARELLRDFFDLSCSVWSVTSWSELARQAKDIDRYNMKNLAEERRLTHIEELFRGVRVPIVGVSDYVAQVPGQIASWMPDHYMCLGTDGFGRSDTREKLREYFGISAKHIAYALAFQKWRQGEVSAKRLQEVRQQWGLNFEERGN